MTTDRIRQDTEFLADLFIDPAIIQGDPALCKTEVGKRALDIYNTFEEDPAKITFGEVQDLVSAEGSQIGRPRPYLAHVNNTAGLLRSLVTKLDKSHTGKLNLPNPTTAHATGLVHDLKATFSDYKLGEQQSKEFDEYLLARMLGWQTMEKTLAMHSDYLGLIRLMTKGAQFPKQEVYGPMIEVLRGDGPLVYEQIMQRFSKFVQGKDNLSPLLLTVVDYIENGKLDFDAENFEVDFEARSNDIIWRYYGKPVHKGKILPLLGQSFVDGGLERIRSYKKIVNTLLRNNPENVELLLKTGLFR